MNFWEIFQGKEAAEKRDKLIATLNKIDEKYSDFFKDRPSGVSRKHDSLEEHYAISQYGPRIQFNKLPNSDLPDYIWQECLAAFHSIYQDQK